MWFRPEGQTMCGSMLSKAYLTVIIHMIMQSMYRISAKSQATSTTYRNLWTQSFQNDYPLRNDAAKKKKKKIIAPKKIIAHYVHILSSEVDCDKRQQDKSLRTYSTRVKNPNALSDGRSQAWT